MELWIDGRKRFEEWNDQLRATVSLTSGRNRIVVQAVDQDDSFSPTHIFVTVPESKKRGPIFSVAKNRARAPSQQCQINSGACLESGVGTVAWAWTASRLSSCMIRSTRLTMTT
jgi:hypothetical protein